MSCGMCWALCCVLCVVLWGQVCNDTSSTVRITCCAGQGAFTCHPPTATTPSSLDVLAEDLPEGVSQGKTAFLLAPHTAANVLLSLEDEVLCELFAKEASQEASQEARTGKDKDREKRTPSHTDTYDGALLQRVHTALFQKLQLGWCFCDGQGNKLLGGGCRAGYMQCAVESMVGTLRTSIPQWKQLLPHPMQIQIAIPSAIQTSSSSLVVLSSKKFYKLAISVRLQLNLLEYLQHRFTHLEVMVVILNDTMIHNHCAQNMIPPAMPHSSYHGSSPSQNPEQPAHTSPCPGPCPVSQSRVVINGRCCVKIPLLAMSSGGPGPTPSPEASNMLSHAVDLCCTRNDTYSVHVLTRFLFIDTTASSSSSSSSSCWWCWPEPFVCTAK